MKKWLMPAFCSGESCQNVAMFAVAQHRQKAIQRKATLQVIESFERLNNSKQLTTKEIQKEITKKVKEFITPAQMELVGMEELPSEKEIAGVVKEIQVSSSFVLFAIVVAYFCIQTGCACQSWGSPSNL